MHEDNTKNMVYSPYKIVSDLSKVLTLNPGDIIYTGTSKSLIAGDGDLVTVKISGIGEIKNKIVAVS
jgi:2-keto-4-pentenoate hydratase/2-oxohepta-3-ene-1,7-dioic acid hydratase in catechol pathway